MRLVNGTSEPELMMWGGQVERWRIINAAAARYVRLSVGRRPFRIVGTGGGLLEGLTITRDVLLTPGDRIDVAVGPFEPGEVLSVLSEPYDRGMGAGDTELFATVRVGPAAPSSAGMPEYARAIEPLVGSATTPTREVSFSERIDAHGDVTFLINGEQHYRDDTGDSRRAAGLGHRQRVEQRPPVSPARFLLSGAGAQWDARRRTGRGKTP